MQTGPFWCFLEASREGEGHQEEHRIEHGVAEHDCRGAGRKGWAAEQTEIHQWDSRAAFLPDQQAMSTSAARRELSQAGDSSPHSAAG